MDALQRYAILDTPPEPAFDELAEIAAGVCETPIALVSLLDRDRQWHKAEYGLGRREIPLEASVCAHAVRQDGVFVVEDLKADARFRRNPLVTGAPRMRYYAGAPIVTPQGEAIGALCVIDRRPRRLAAHKLEVLQVLARQVVVQLELRSALAALEQARHGAERSEVFLRRTVDALVDHIAIVDPRGRIVYVNRAWEQFARENAAPTLLAGLGAGANYLEVCAAAAAAGEPAAAEVGAAIRAALAGTAPEFNAEYPCHAPRERRWFIVRVSAFAAAENRYAVVSHQNITARRTAENEVRALNEELESRVQRRTQALERAREEVRGLNRRLLQAEEGERRRLGRELHDRVGQNLSALGIALQLARDRLSPESRERVADGLQRAQEQVEAATADVRTVMAELRPPGLEDYGLLTALRNHAEALGQQTGAAIVVHGAEPQPRLPAETEVALYRIAQEAIANALKHARAARIDVRLERAGGALCLSVADDGVGFDPGGERAQASWGLVTMRERAEAAGARFEVDAAPGRGTRVAVRVDG